ncbi:alpha/beta hydrolase [Streptomyces sp. CRN 30]|uniref:alpha/beta hydrolase n=1 Tax=Streptomyces sp. CRN 30 TaxID=3075613 RepID=UPI002A823A03|nr:alpha/beta hydrolase [Streptomyces sp. CRN 30]
MRIGAAVLCAVVTAGTLMASPSLAGTGAAPARAGDPAVTAGPAWKGCGTDDHPTLQCASLEVPLDHERPRGRRITLALTRVPHTARTYQGPLLVNPGGPGGSGRALAGFVASALPERVAAEYDVVGFDPRGVGASRPALNCRPGHFAPVRPAPWPATPAAEAANRERAAAFASGCARRHGDVLPHMGTVSAARDMDVIRRALGARRINYFGYSYGTYLGAVYAKLHPHRVRRMALDSVVDPTRVWYDSNLLQDRALGSRHRAFLAWVARHDEVYRLGGDPAEVEAAWYGMREALTERPAGGTVGAGELEDAFLPGGYHHGHWPRLAEVFAAYVNDGDGGPLVAAYRDLGAVDAAGENTYSVYTAVQCHDAAWPRDWRRWRRDNRAVHEAAPFITWNNAWYNAPCAFWPTAPLEPLDVSNDALPPVLLLQSTHDGATPFRGAATLHRLLRGSRLVVEDGGGNHGVTLRGNACLDRHLAAYLADGTVPRGTGGADARCARLPDPEPSASGAGTRAGTGSGPGPETGGRPGTRPPGVPPWTITRASVR